VVALLDADASKDVQDDVSTGDDPLSMTPDITNKP